MDRNELISTLVGGFLTGGSVKVIFDYLRQRRQDKQLVQTSAVETAERVLVVSRETIDRLHDDVGELRTRLDDMDQRLNRWSGFYRDLVARWDHYRAEGTPPPPPTNTKE